MGDNLIVDIHSIAHQKQTKQTNKKKSPHFEKDSNQQQI